MSESHSGEPDVYARLHALALVFRPCRFSVALVLLGAAVLFVPPQSFESLRAICEQNDIVGMAGLALATLWWGHTSWYFARVMLRFVYPDQVAPHDGTKKMYEALVRTVPRALGLAPFVVVGLALALCRDDAHVGGPLGGVVLLVGAVFFVVITYRRRLLGRMRDRFDAPRRDARVRSLWSDLGELGPTKRAIKELPFVTRACLAAHLGVFLALLVAFTAWPVPIAQALGAPTILVMSMAAWIAAGTAITYASIWLRAPIFVGLAAMALLVSPLNDDHRVGTRAGADIADRRDIARDFTEWESLRQARGPFIVIATEGGGIRAAYWTAAALAKLQDDDPAFASRVYGISSVSGGSVGAAVFVAALADSERTPNAAHAPDEMRERLARILSIDSLAPPLAKMLYPDLVQRLLPFSWSALDRGVALEQSWTRAVGSEVAENVFEEPFERVWRQHPRLPRLFLNSTWVETGKRIVLSWPAATPACRDAIDGCAAVNLRLAQAVHASARFPYISPAGTFENVRDGLPGHVVDGGYFENSGAATAEEILRAIGRPEDARVIVIRFEEDTKPSIASWATELTAPPLTMLAARDARGTLALRSLEESVPEKYRVVFRLRARPGKPRLPLGWMLSRSARQEIDEQATSDPENLRSAAVVSGWFR